MCVSSIGERKVLTIIIDTSEQRPYSFTGIKDQLGQWEKINRIRRKLRHGDYTIPGLEHTITVERKSQEDFSRSLLSDRVRFQGCVERMHEELTVAHIVTAADWSSYNKHTSWTIRSTITSWTLRYPNVHWWLMGTRRKAEVFTFRILQMAERKFYGRT